MCFSGETSLPCTGRLVMSSAVLWSLWCLSWECFSQYRPTIPIQAFDYVFIIGMKQSDISQPQKEPLGVEGQPSVERRPVPIAHALGCARDPLGASSPRETLTCWQNWWERTQWNNGRDAPPRPKIGPFPPSPESLGIRRKGCHFKRSRPEIKTRAWIPASDNRPQEPAVWQPQRVIIGAQFSFLHVVISAQPHCQWPIKPSCIWGSSLHKCQRPVLHAYLWGPLIRNTNEATSILRLCCSGRSCLPDGSNDTPPPLYRHYIFMGMGSLSQAWNPAWTCFQQASVISAEGSRLPWVAWPPPAIPWLLGDPSVNLKNSHNLKVWELCFIW